MAEIEIVLETCRQVVHKKSIRVQEFFVDFDRLRSGLVHPNHFVSALGIAGIDKSLSEHDLDALKRHYLVRKEGNQDLIDYKSFCNEVYKKSCVNASLKKMKSRKQLTQEEESRVAEMLGKVSEVCRQKGLLINPMFADFANSNNSTKLVGHVTKQQFHRALDVKLGIRISENDASLLCAKYSNPDYEEMMNYAAFSKDVIPEEKPYNPYTEV